MRLLAASLDPPEGLEAFLREIGEGESGFAGTEFVTRSMTLPDFLQRLVDYAGGRNLDPGHVPSTTFWVLDDAGEVIGLVRLRHHLNDALLRAGGHIGYYLRPAARGKGYGAEMLRLALVEARRTGIDRALLTVNSNNPRSIRVIESNGGVMEEEGLHPDDGQPYRRYWIDLGDASV
jgi:predicted acetyltransferase